MKHCVWKLVVALSLFVAQCGNLSLVYASGEPLSEAIPLNQGESDLLPPSLQTNVTCACKKNDCTITLVFPASAQIHQELFEEKTRRACEIAQKKMAASLIDDFSIFLDERPVDHNGLTTVIPTNRISVHLEAPEMESSIGLGRDFLLETLVHEISHMIVTQQRSGIFSFLDHLVGNSSRPLGAWPRWMHEGMAVWTEAAVGGRPESGIVDWDLRKYAEYFARTKKHPLTTSDLDGTFHNRQVEPGAVPYHFGYQLIKAWEDARQMEKGAGWGPMLEDWSQSLGVSFRVLFRDDVKMSLETFFEREREAWSQVSLPKVSMQHRVEVAKAPHIEGPFRFVHRSSNGSLYNSLSWIERSGKRFSNSLLKGRFDEGPIASLKWNRSYSFPLSTFYFENKWLVLFSQIPTLSKDHLLRGLESPQRMLSMFGPNGKELCTFQSWPDRVREIALHQSQLAWIRTLEDLGTQVAERATFDENCQLTEVVEMARSRVPFERLSGLWINEEKFVLSRSRSTAPYEVVEYDGKEYSSNFPVGQAYLWGSYLVMHQFSKAAFATGWVNLKENDLTYRMFASTTGSFRSAPTSLFENGKKPALIIKESFWDEDRLVAIQTLENPKNGPALSSKNIETASWIRDSEESAKATSSEVYSPWKSLWPQFWLPTLQAYSEGYTIFGQTFFSDLRGEYSGSFSLGYDSYARRPFFATSLSRRGFVSFPVSALSLSFYSSPSTILRNSQLQILDRIGGILQSDWSMAFPATGLRFSSLLSAKFENFNGGGIFADKAYLSPALALNLFSKSAQSSLAPDFRLADTQSSFLTQAKLRWIQDLEWSSTLQGILAVKRMGFALRVDYAKTDLKNYPLSYFEFGGQYSFATSLPQYVSRGFPPRLGIAKELMRVEAQMAFPLNNLRSGLSFSRLRFAELEGRVIAETVTFAPFGASRFSVGRGYFTSVGGEINLFGTLSQYIKYSSVLGVYKGIGEFGENRIALRISSYLDL
jgi:hypothetical protein